MVISKGEGMNIYKKVICVVIGFSLITCAVAKGVDQNELKIEAQLLIKQIQLQQQIVEIDQTILAAKKRKLGLVMKQLINHGSNQKGFNWVLKNSPGFKDAIEAGVNNGQKVYICRANYKGLQTGQLYPEGCMISYAGKAFIKKTFKVLVTKNAFSWEGKDAFNRYQFSHRYRPFPFAPGPVILNPKPFSKSVPIIGGSEKGENRYICRGIYNNKIYVGKVVANNCNIGFDHREVRLDAFEVLFGDLVRV